MSEITNPTGATDRSLEVTVDRLDKTLAELENQEAQIEPTAEEEEEEKEQPIQPSSGRGEGRAAFKDTNKDRKPGAVEEELTKAVVAGGLETLELSLIHI